MKNKLAIAYATKRHARKMAKGGIIENKDQDSALHDMAGNPERFLSDEMQDTPFHSFDYDNSESSGLFDDYSMNNTEDNADQNESRTDSNIMNRIMRKLRMRHMGK